MISILFACFLIIGQKWKQNWGLPFVFFILWIPTPFLICFSFKKWDP